MKKLTLTILAILLATFFTTAQTIIPAGPVEGTWTINNSPYEIQGAINVVHGTTLTIEPGVIVRFNTFQSFEINGCLLAQGTEQDSILFKSYDPFEKWGGIGWPSTSASNDSSKVDYCIFENSFAYGTQVGYNSGGAIRVKEFDKLRIQHSTFRYNLADQYG